MRLKSLDEIVAKTTIGLVLMLGVSACVSPVSRPDRIIEPAREVSPKPSTARTIRIATWNIETVGEASSDEHKAALAVVRRINPDVLAINEVSGKRDVENLKNFAVKAGYPTVVVAPRSGFGSDRNAILSRIPVISSRTLYSPGISGDPSAEDISRGFPLALMDLGEDGKTLLVIAAHWKSGVSNRDEFRRAVESFRLAQISSGLFPEVSLVLVVGDVNDEPTLLKRTPRKFVEVPPKLPRRYSLGGDLEAQLDSAGLINNPFEILASKGFTIAEARQLDGSLGTRPASGRRLDYVFYSSDLAGAVGLAEVYDSRDEGLPRGLRKWGAPLGPDVSLRASDHLPVFLDLPIPTQ